MRALRPSIVWLAAVFFACGPPSSFDGLVDGRPVDAGLEADTAVPIELRPDGTLPAPRLVQPLSGSWVNGSRPRFRWALAQGTTGARVELCRTRACDGEKKTFEATGAELIAPEDLAPGIWFWRLSSKTPETIGTPSFVWEVLVRGGPATDKANASNGSIVDLNGDGRADLIVTLEYVVGADTVLDVIPLLATNDDSTAFATTDKDGLPVRGFELGVSDTAIAAGTDFDGDGYPDLAFHDRFGNDPRQILVVPGSAKGYDAARITTVPTPLIDEPPNLQEAGDIDGDGWGDLVVTTRTTSLGFFGTGRGLGPFQYLVQSPSTSPDAGAIDGGLPPLTVPMSVSGAFDRNADGFSDLALTSPFPESPIIFFLGEPKRDLLAVIPTVVTKPLPTRAQGMVSGDFDGDGLTDTAFVTTVEGKSGVCVFDALEKAEQANVVCWTPDPTPAGFAVSMTACDLEGDGKDEILVSTTAGIEVIRRTATGLTPELIATPFGAPVTTIFPGRPGPATWAAMRADRTAIGIFRGTSQSGMVPLFDPQAKRFGPRIR